MSNSDLHPRATIHKRILDIAESNPELSADDIAAQVSGASRDLIEKVLEEYRNPTEKLDGGTKKEEKASEVRNDEKQGGNLTEKQEETLRAIYENPNASQKAIGEALGVSQSTVNNRVNSIEGFDWETRGEFVEDYFGNSHSNRESQNEETERKSELEDISLRLSKLEEAMNELKNGRESESGKSRVFEDTELVHKIIHACMESENITEEEELRIIKRLI